MLETVEASLSVPSPEEMAREKAADEVKEHDVRAEEILEQSGGGSSAG